jgi:hypothetical protein
LITTLQPETASPGFGQAVSSWDNEVVIGAPESGRSAEGQAFIYTHGKAGWTDTELTDPAATALDEFGTAVAIDGSTAIVGDGGVDTDTGAVYVYTDTAGKWAVSAKLTASDGVAHEVFGEAVALDGKTALVSNDRDEVYVFSDATGSWSQTAILRPVSPDPNNLDQFGFALALSSGWAVIGAPGVDGGKGAAYVFTDGTHGWVKTKNLVSNPASEGYFGATVAAAGSQVMVGAPAGHYVQLDKQIGEVFVFDHSSTGWSQTAELIAPGTSRSDRGTRFGQELAMSSDEAVITAPVSEAVYLYDDSAGSWVRQARIQSGGTVVSLSQNQAFVSSASAGYVDDYKA